MEHQKDKAKQFIKGKIAEVVFEQMFRYATSKFTVIPFGYESVMPDLVQSVRRSGDRNLLETVKNAPDFALVKHDPEEVLLVEVKYRSFIRSGEVRETARAINGLWKSAWLFYATERGFFFGKCSDLMRGEEAPELPDAVIPLDVQAKYHKLLMGFVT